MDADRLFGPAVASLALGVAANALAILVAALRRRWRPHGRRAAWTLLWTVFFAVVVIPIAFAQVPVSTGTLFAGVAVAGLASVAAGLTFLAGALWPRPRA